MLTICSAANQQAMPMVSILMRLLQLAFDHIGSMPMSKIQEHRAEKQAIMSADLRQRSSKKNLHRAIQRGSSMTGPSGKGALSFSAMLHQAQCSLSVYP
jgi:hypothetical protein